MYCMNLLASVDFNCCVECWAAAAQRHNGTPLKLLQLEGSLSPKGKGLLGAMTTSLTTAETLEIQLYFADDLAFCSTHHITSALPFWPHVVPVISAVTGSPQYSSVLLASPDRVLFLMHFKPGR